MGSDTGHMAAFFDEYAAAMTSMMTTGVPDAVAACYDYPALVIRDEVSWAYEDAEPLARDFEVLRQQAVGAGIVDAAADVTTVEPLTEVLTSVDVDFDFTNADGEALLRQSWRYVVQSTAAGPRIRSVAIRTRSDA